jgi:hypothetical protein
MSMDVDDSKEDEHENEHNELFIDGDDEDA